MHRFKLLLFGLVLSGICLTAEAASGKIVKVLPHLLDKEGLHARSPSLYERDAYQAYLRKHPELCSGIRFDIQWKASMAKPSQLKLKLELRTSKSNPVEPLVIEQPAKSTTWLGHWTPIALTGDKYKGIGNVIAWRATLYNGAQQLAKQQSFLW